MVKKPKKKRRRRRRMFFSVAIVAERVVMVALMKAAGWHARCESGHVMSCRDMPCHDMGERG